MKMTFIVFTALLCLILSSITRQGDARRGVRITPDILLRNFVPEAEPSAEIGDSASTHPTDLTMNEIMEALRHHYGLRNATVEQPSSRFMLELYQNLERGSSLSSAAGHRRVDTAILQADTVRSVSARELMQEGRGKVTMTFSLGGVTSTEVMKRAELRMRAFRHEEGSLFRARVVVMKKGVVLATLNYRLRSKRATRDGHALFDLTDIVRDVLAADFYDVTLTLTLRRPRDSQHAARSRRSHRPHITELKDTMLVMFTRNEDFFKKFQYDLQEITNTPGRKSLVNEGRAKRDTAIFARPLGVVKLREAMGVCHRQALRVDFELIGWDRWIIYPKQYNAYYCGGKCPNPPTGNFNPTNHAILQSLMRMRDKGSVPRPCCAPTKLQPISMLYFESDEIVVRRHEDMVVDECGCR